MSEAVFLGRHIVTHAVKVILNQRRTALGLDPLTRMQLLALPAEELARLKEQVARGE